MYCDLSHLQHRHEDLRIALHCAPHELELGMVGEELQGIALSLATTRTDRAAKHVEGLCGWLSSGLHKEDKRKTYIHTHTALNTSDDSLTTALNTCAPHGHEGTILTESYAGELERARTC